MTILGVALPYTGFEDTKGGGHTSIHPKLSSVVIGRVNPPHGTNDFNIELKMKCLYSYIIIITQPINCVLSDLWDQVEVQVHTTLAGLW